MLNQESSHRLAVLRFPLIVGVVFVHAYETAVAMGGQTIGASQNSALVDFVRNIISQGLARTAVPLFFLMSGYLFFYAASWSQEQYARKLRSRTRTLLVPFLFWNLAVLLAYAMAQHYPASARYFSGKTPIIAQFGLFDYLDAVFGLTHMPIAYQFWFIRDLMLLVMLAPLIHFLTRKLALPCGLLLFACWFASRWPVPLLSVEASLFFSAGCWLGSGQRSLFALDRYAPWAAPLYLAVLVADALLISQPLHPYLQKIGILLGVVVVLYATRYALRSARLRDALLWLAGASFFVFAAHEPLLTLARKLTYKVLSPDTPAALLGLYFAIPLSLIIGLLLAYRLLSAVLPRFTGVITGGR